MAARKRPDVAQLSADAPSLMDLFNEGSDLVCVLVSTSYLDAALVSLLQRHLVPGKTSAALLEAEGALGTLASRTDAAYCLGLIPKTLYQNARLIGQVRNRFAHNHLAIDFQDPQAAELVRKLALPSLVGGDPDGMVLRMAATPRSHYTIVAAGMILRLLNLATELEQRSPSSQPW